MNIRNLLTGLIASAALTGLVSCGSGGGDSAAPTYTVGGTLSGSVGPVVLQLNGAGDITLANPGTFTFPTGLANGATYAATANGAQNCNVTNGSGTMGSTNISNVTVTCTSVVRSANLSSAQENPPNVSTATGSGGVIVNPTTREVTGGVTFAGLTPTGHHIHQSPAGNPGGNGPVIISLILAPDGRTATVPAATVLTDAQYAALLAGELYLNVHTAAYPGGEIRGPLSVRGGVTAGLAALSGAQEVPPTGSTAIGRGTVMFNSTTRNVIVAYATHNVAAATVSHIHTGASGVNGPANVVTLTAATNLFVAPSASTLSAQGATDVATGNTYFNVHSTTNPGGEIRGQIAIQ